MPGRRTSSLLIMALCLAAAPVRAQTAPVLTADSGRSIAEVMAGLSIQGRANANDRTPPEFGIAVSAVAYPSDVVGIAGELSAYASPSSSDARQANRGRAALAGLQARTHLIRNGRTRWRLFGQVLGGPQWTDFGPRRQVLQPGVGADDYLLNGIAVHVQYDYRFAPDGIRDPPTGRFLVGIGLPLGSR